MSGDIDNPAAVCAHLRSLEAALLDPAVRRDQARVAALLADDFLEFGSSGRVWTRDQILDMLATEDDQPPAMEDFQCHLLSEDVALVTFRTVRVDTQTGQDICVLRSSLWTCVTGEWRVRFHHGTRVL